MPREVRHTPGSLVQLGQNNTVVTASSLSPQDGFPDVAVPLCELQSHASLTTPTWLYATLLKGGAALNLLTFYAEILRMSSLEGCAEDRTTRAPSKAGAVTPRGSCAEAGAE